MPQKLEKGCLVIHGLTGTPATMKPLIDRLIRAGFEVNAPLLPGHGTDPSGLLDIGWYEWWEAVVDAYHDIQRTTRKVSCVGLSLGSLLALRLAAAMKWGVRAVVSMGTPLVLGNWIEYLAHPMVKYTPVRWFYKYSRKDWVKSIEDAGGREFYMRHSYDKIAIRAVLEIFKLKKDVREMLGAVTSPVLVLHGKNDLVAPLKNVKIIKKGLKSNMVDVMILERSKHVVTLDYDRDIVATAVVKFLNRFS